ncbi:anti-sigma factor [Oxalobacteraceae bacterium CAVE-383]|nr:anti-sigma factor [Oxalobacteraceae bacterium CAVE-383]
MNQFPVTEQELQAYVDELLPAARRAEIEAYLQARPAEAERIAAYREQNRALHALFDPILQEPAPRHLTVPSPLPAPAANLGLFASHWRQLAACAVLALCSGIGGWLLHAATARDGNMTMATAQDAAYIHGGDDLARHAAIAHVTFSPEARHPVEVGIDQEAHLVAWLSKRLGTALRPPKLHALGYDLIGGRLLPGDDGPVAQFMYQDNAGARLTLYVSTEQEGKHETAFRFSQENGVSVFYWIDGKFGYALSAAMPKAALGHIADAVYRQLEAAS